SNWKPPYRCRTLPPALPEAAFSLLDQPRLPEASSRLLPPNARPLTKYFDRPAASSVTSRYPASRRAMSDRAAVIGHGEPARTGEAIGLLVTKIPMPAPFL